MNNQYFLSSFENYLNGSWLCSTALGCTNCPFFWQMMCGCLTSVEISLTHDSQECTLTFWRPGNLNLALLSASITLAVLASRQRTEMIFIPILTRATVPWGLPKAPRIPVWSLKWGADKEWDKILNQQIPCTNSSENLVKFQVFNKDLILEKLLRKKLIGFHLVRNNLILARFILIRITSNQWICFVFT